MAGTGHSTPFGLFEMGELSKRCHQSPKKRAKSQARTYKTIFLTSGKWSIEALAAHVKLTTSCSRAMPAKLPQMVNKLKIETSISLEMRNEEIKMIKDWLHNSPRKQLGFKTRAKALHQSLRRVALSPCIRL